MKKNFVVVMFITLAMLCILSSCASDDNSMTVVSSSEEVIFSSSHSPNISEPTVESSMLAESSSSNDTELNDTWKLTPNDAAYTIFSKPSDSGPYMSYWKIPGYDYAAYPSEGLFRVFDGQKFAYLNATDMSVVIPFEYDYAHDFFDGYACVIKGEKWGLIDKNNTEILPFEYDLITKYCEGFVLTYPIGHSFWNKGELTMAPDVFAYSYQIIRLDGAELIYSSEMLICETNGQNSGFGEILSATAADNQYPAICYDKVKSQQFNTNGLWTDKWTGTGTESVITQIQEDLIYEVLMWDDSIPYELIDLN